MGGTLLYGCKALIFLCHAYEKIRQAGWSAGCRRALLFKQVRYFLLFFFLLGLSGPVIAQEKAAGCGEEGRQLCFDQLEVYEIPVPPEEKNAPPEQAEENGLTDASQDTQKSYINAEKKPAMTVGDGYYEVDIENGGFYAFE